MKKVSFAKEIVQSSPKVKRRPQEEQSTLLVGSFEINLAQFGLATQNKPRSGILLKPATRSDDEDISDVQTRRISAIQKETGSHRDMIVDNAHRRHERSGTLVSISNLNLNSNNQKSCVGSSTIVNARRLGLCSHCFGINHKASNCFSAVRCASCYNYRHKYKWCITRKKPKICWRPKLPPNPEAEGAAVNSVNSSPPDVEEGCHYIASSKHIGNLPRPPRVPPDESSSDHPMANFVVNPAPYVPEGLEVENWECPACGRIVITGNPTRKHEDFAIVTVFPPPQHHALYEEVDEVVDYFEGVHRVRVLSACLSPLGLCLLQF